MFFQLILVLLVESWTKVESKEQPATRASLVSEQSSCVHHLREGLLSLVSQHLEITPQFPGGSFA